MRTYGAKLLSTHVCQHKTPFKKKYCAVIAIKKVWLNKRKSCKITSQVHIQLSNIASLAYTNTKYGQTNVLHFLYTPASWDHDHVDMGLQGDLHCHMRPCITSGWRYRNIKVAWLRQKASKNSSKSIAKKGAHSAHEDPHVPCTEGKISKEARNFKCKFHHFVVLPPGKRQEQQVTSFTLCGKPYATQGEKTKEQMYGDNGNPLQEVVFFWPLLFQMFNTLPVRMRAVCLYQTSASSGTILTKTEEIMTAETKSRSKAKDAQEKKTRGNTCPNRETRAQRKAREKRANKSTNKPREWHTTVQWKVELCLFGAFLERIALTSNICPVNLKLLHANKKRPQRSQYLCWFSLIDEVKSQKTFSLLSLTISDISAHYCISLWPCNLTKKLLSLKPWPSSQ